MKNIAKWICVFFFLLFNLLLSQTLEDILPVELVYFEAYSTSGGILLRWGTATETNNFGFEIQRADSSYQFVGIDFVPGSGTSNSPKHYFYVDTSLVEFGLYHYRLKIIDIDGPFTFSDTVHVLYQPAGVVAEKSKTPADVVLINDRQMNELIIKLNESGEFDEISLSIYNIIGEKLFVKNFLNVSGSIHFNYSFLANGVYLISLQSKNKILSFQKFIVLH